MADIKDLEKAARAGTLDRREFIKRAGALGLAAPLYRSWPLFRERGMRKRDFERTVKREFVEKPIGLPLRSTDQAIQQRDGSWQLRFCKET